MQKISLFFWLIFIIGCSQNKPPNPFAIDLQKEIVDRKYYIAPKAMIPPVIDGKGDDEGWQKAQFSEAFIDIEGVKKPKFQTRMKLLWDEHYFYVYAEMEEPHIWGNLRQRDTVIFYNNDFEIFISPSGSTQNYAEIEINSLGTVWDLLLDRPYRDQGRPVSHWNLDNLKTEIHIDGTLNDPTDIDALWAVEMAIPMPALLALKRKKRLPKEGEQWRLNFSRVEWDYDLINGRYARKKDKDGTYLPEYNWVWSNQNTINMHEPEKWGTVQFSHKSSAEAVDVIHDPTDRIKQIAYALYRKTRFGDLREYRNKDIGYSQDFQINYGQDLPAVAYFYKTHFGFEYYVKGDDVATGFVINESGILKPMP